MSARGFLARAALYAYPAEFRSQFGDQILADIEDDHAAPLTQFIDFIRSGVAMRFDSLLRDLAYAFRRLRQAPLFVAIVILTFALGIGANVAVFSVLSTLVLRPLPVAHSSSLAVLISRGSGGGPQAMDFPAVSPNDVSDIRAQSHAFAAFAAVKEDSRTLLLDGKPYALNGLDATAPYFPMLGIDVQAGRVLTEPDGRPGVHNIVISNALWHKRFGAAEGIIGHNIMLDTTPYRVVGIMRPRQLLVDPESESLDDFDFLTALPSQADPTQRGARLAGGLAELAPGVDFKEANADLALVSSRLSRAYPKTNRDWLFKSASLHDVVVGRTIGSVWMLFVAVVGILLIACANVGNMLAARWSTRDREVAIRRSLGASSSRVAAQLLVETAMLAFAGACCGIVIAYGALAATHDMLAQSVPLGSVIQIDGITLVYALAVVIGATLLSGLSPLSTLRRTDLHTVLKSAGRSGDASRGHNLRSFLVVAETALALALVIVSGLVLRSYANMINTPLGIRPQGVVASDIVRLPAQYASSSAADPVAAQLLNRLQSSPGIDSVALAWFYPQSNAVMMSGFPVFGRKYRDQEPLAISNSVTPEYFKALGTPIRAGRAFTAADRANSQAVAIVDTQFVERYLHGVEPLGARIGIPTGPDTSTWATIVGVVASQRVAVRAEVIGGVADLPEVYTPIAQRWDSAFAIVAHTSGVDATTAVREIHSAFAAVLPRVPPPDAFTIEERIINATVNARFVTGLLAALAIIALLLALTGIFGVMSFSVTQRMREFGIRIALGATARSIVGDVLGRSLALALTGCALGIVIAAFAARAIVAQLNGVSPVDPATFGAVVALVVAFSTLASLQPALRAIRVEPAESLRYE